MHITHVHRLDCTSEGARIGRCESVVTELAAPQYGMAEKLQTKKNYLYENAHHIKQRKCETTELAAMSFLFGSVRRGYNFVCAHICIHGYMHTYTHICAHSCIYTYMHIYIYGMGERGARGRSSEGIELDALIGGMSNERGIDFDALIWKEDDGGGNRPRCW